MASLTEEHVPTVFHLLQQSVDPSPQIRQPSMDQLKTLERASGYCSILYRIILSKEADHNTRFLAAIQFKNCIDKYWRDRTDSQGVSQQEKTWLRSQLLNLLNEESTQISVQIAILISKIARLDYPQAWPQLLDNLVELFQRGSQQQQHRALLSLKQVILQLSSKRLPHCKREFVQVTKTYFAVIEERWCASIRSALANANTPAEGAETKSQKEEHQSGRAALHVLKTLLLAGLPPDVSQLNGLPKFLSDSHHFLGAFLSSGLVEGREESGLFKHAVKLVKVLSEIVETQAEAILPLMTPFFELFYKVLISAPLSSSIHPLLLNTLLFLKTFIENASSDPSPTDLLTPERTKELTEILLGKYLLLTEEDLSLWHSDPEQFYLDNELVSWNSKLYPCAQAVFTSLLMKRRIYVATVVVERLQKLIACEVAEGSPNYNHWLLQKEATYSAIGLGYNDLYDHLHFPSFFAQHLAKDVQNPSPMSRVIRRRVGVVIGCWVSDLTADLRNNIYKILLNMMAEPDFVVNLTATNSLKILVGDCMFSVDEFSEYLGIAVDLLFGLLQRLQLDDAKLQVLDVLSTLTERVANKMTPYTERLLSCLSDLWRHYLDHKLMKGAIVLSLKRLVKVQDDGVDGPVLDLLIGVIEYCTGISESERLYLEEQALSLWLHTLRKTRSFPPKLFTLLPNLFSSLSLSFEFIKRSLNILEAYLLLAPIPFLQMYLNDLIGLFEKLVGNLKDKPTIQFTRLVETFVQVAPEEVLPKLEATLAGMLNHIHVLNGTESSLVLVEYLSLFGRVLLHSPKTFFGFFQRLPAPQDTLSKFVDIWLENIDQISNLPDRKLWCLGLSFFFPVPYPFVLDKVPLIVDLCINVLNDIDSSIQRYGIDLFNVGPIVDAGGPLFVQQRRIVFSNDPVSKIDLKKWISEKLREATANNPDTFRVALDGVDPVILTQFQEILQRDVSAGHPLV